MRGWLEALQPNGAAANAQRHKKAGRRRPFPGKPALLWFITRLNSSLHCAAATLMHPQRHIAMKWTAIVFLQNCTNYLIKATTWVLLLRPFVRDRGRLKNAFASLIFQNQGIQLADNHFHFFLLKRAENKEQFGGVCAEHRRLSRLYLWLKFCLMFSHRGDAYCTHHVTGRHCEKKGEMERFPLNKAVLCRVWGKSLMCDWLQSQQGGEISKNNGRTSLKWI